MRPFQLPKFPLEKRTYGVRHSRNRIIDCMHAQRDAIAFVQRRIVRINRRYEPQPETVIDEALRILKDQ